MTSGTAELDLLRSGELTVTGRMVAASNATFQGEVSAGDRTATVIYKPVAGERPLWDFPDGTLAQREYAAYLVSEALGWCLVPPTLLRDGPFGEGMCQLWVDVDERELVDIVPRGEVADGWLGVLEAYDGRDNPVTLVHADVPELRRMAVFDAIVNNADRKGGHILCAADGAVYGVDHGVTFNADEKLRTVLWGWAGGQVPDDIVADVRHFAARLDGPLGDELGRLLTPEEVAVTRARVRRLVRQRRYPVPSEDRHVIPWPAF
jgi:uncharacterized repeat protein (TIGR03843 family)